jgi:hypothetical protein
MSHLVVWGENSAFSTAARKTLIWVSSSVPRGFKPGVTQGDSRRLDRAGLTRSELAAYFGPSAEELDRAKVNAMFLGYYFRWDPEATRAVAEAHGFKANPGGARAGYYDFADIDDDFISLHHWMKWYKFGFTRAFDNLSLEIHNRRMTRARAVVYCVSAATTRAPTSKILRLARIFDQTVSPRPNDFT